MEITKKKLQLTVDKQSAESAENIIYELGLTPAIVINALYKQISATGEIPLNLKLTSKQKVEQKIDLPTVNEKANTKTKEAILEAAAKSLGLMKDDDPEFDNIDSLVNYLES